jgi:hypothetical protein
VAVGVGIALSNEGFEDAVDEADALGVRLGSSGLTPHEETSATSLGWKGGPRTRRCTGSSKNYDGRLPVR